LAAEFNVNYMETSASLGINIDEAFDRIANSVVVRQISDGLSEATNSSANVQLQPSSATETQPKKSCC
jgi:hypothetical protein